MKQSYQTARNCLALILLLCALYTLAACSPRVVFRDREVRVEVPGPMQSVPAELVADCAPEPAQDTSIGALIALELSEKGCLDSLRVNARRLRSPAPVK
jgi:hypothetical protein